MPVMDGYDTIRAIRKISDFKVLPIVAVTGKAAAGERQRCLDSGADDYIPKPVDTAQLLAALTPWLPIRRVAGHPMSIATDSLGTGPWTRCRTSLLAAPDPHRRRQSRRSGWR